MANNATGSERDLSKTKELISSFPNISLSDTENDEDHKWKHSNDAKSIRRVEHNDPAILSYGGFSQRFVASQETVATSKKERSNSPNLSTSEPDVRSILRYSRESLLTLRDSELSKRKPEQLGRAWARIGVSNEDREGRGRDDNECASNYSSNTSLTNASSSSYLLPSFATKRRIPGSSQSSSTEIKRNTALTPKKEDSANSSSSVGGRRSISNSRNSNSAEDEDSRGGDRDSRRMTDFIRRQNEYRNANEGRRIGSGRIPLRDTWDDPKYGRGNGSEFPTKSSGDQTSSSPTNSTTTTTQATTTTPSKSEQSKTCETSSSDFNLRPGGGLLGLRDRQRENEQQQSQTSIVTQPHPHLTRTILGNNSILDKDSRSDFRERSVLGDDRYDRNDRMDRNDRLDRNDRMDRNDRGDRNDRMDRNDRGDRRFNRDRDYGRYNDDVMPRNRYNNHGDRMNSYSQYSFSSNENRNRRQYNDRNEEPEWFSGGPTSQNDTIELRGFEDYTTRRDSPSSRNSGDVDEDKATADYGSDVEKVNEENDKSNDNNNNDKSGNDEANHRDTEKTNDFEPEDIEVANAEPKPNKKDDNFNFEDFLKAENLTDLLTGGEETSNSESRFSRWFRPEEPKPNPNQLPEKVTESNRNENGEKNMFFGNDAGNTNDTNGKQNTFLQFLQNQKLLQTVLNVNITKQPSEMPHGLPPHQMMDNNNPQQHFQQQQQQMPHPAMMANHGQYNVKELEARLRQFGPAGKPPNNIPNDVGNHGPLTLNVEELEARLRQSGPTAPKSSNNLTNDVSAMNNSQQQDMVAFKKLLQQISGDQPQPSPPLQQPHQPKMFPFGSVPPLQAQNQQQRQLPSLMQHPEVKKMLLAHMPSVPIISPQQRMEILKRPETQVLIQRLNSGELNQGFIIQQLNNPQVNQRDREVLHTVLSHFNPVGASAQPSPPENNMPHPGMPSNMPVPNANIPPNMQTPNNAALSPDMLRQMYLGVTGSKQQLRISPSLPLPNGIPQRIPSPRELQFHTQSIMQNALIKKKLEEQRENFRKRQEQQQQTHMNPNLVNNSNGIIDGMHENPMNQQQMNRGVSPNSSAALKQLSQNQHTSSPTPTLAFTPTSVLRKMTAEKDIDNSTNSANAANINNKDMNKQQQHHQHQQNNVFRMQQNIPIQGMQGMPIQGIQAMQQMGMQGLQQNKFLPIQPNNTQQIMAQQKGRPIVKGNGISNQFAANDFPQAFLMGVNNNSNRPPQFNLEQQRQQQFQLQHAQQAQFHHMMQQHQQMMGGPQMMVQAVVNEQQQRSNGDGTLSPTSNQLARWFSPELLAQASAGKLPSLDATQALSLEEFERNMHLSTTVNN